MWKWRWWFCCAAVGIGVIRLASWYPHPDQKNHIFNYATGQEKQITAQVATFPDQRRNKQQLIVQPTGMTGRILVTVPSFPVYRFGQTITVTCRFERPEPVDTFAYHLWLAARRVFAVCRQPDIGVVAEPTGWQKIVGTIRTEAVAAVQQSLPEPVASLAAAIVFAERGMMATDTLDQLAASGVVHIISVSGMHVSIVTLVLWQGLLAIGCSRRVAAGVVAGTLALFLLLIGWPAPAVRAAAMGGLVVLASVTGRLPHGPWLLLFITAVTFAANPLLAVYDIGWQLSITAMAGLLLVAQPLDQWCQRRLPWLPNRAGIRTTITTSVAAQLTTAPLSLAVFGQVSLVAPLANVLVAPLVPPLMAATFLVAVCQFTIPVLAVIPATVAWACGSIFLTLSQLISRLPGATIQWTMEYSAVAVSYSVMVCGMYGYWWRRRLL